jgi:hypothetical protein
MVETLILTKRTALAQNWMTVRFDLEHQSYVGWTASTPPKLIDKTFAIWLGSQEACPISASTQTFVKRYLHVASLLCTVANRCVGQSCWLQYTENSMSTGDLACAEPAQALDAHERARAYEIAA